MAKKKISVMIPCYNEEENARPIYEAVCSEMKRSLPEYDYEILFIDNCSQDRTQQIIEEICAEDKHVKAIFNAKNFGQFNSPYYGVLQTSGDCTIIPVSYTHLDVYKRQFPRRAISSRSP